MPPGALIVLVTAIGLGSFMENMLPETEVPIATGPVLLSNTEPAPPVLATKLVTFVTTGFNVVPILPVPEVRMTKLLVIVPEV